jgi:osomolarity two-component system sensor histidine kinase SLN1
MSEELVMQYDRLEERVKVRTAELEKSKKAAEVANESKTLFIANISHELKTPLNGILGLCAVCMQEDDMRKIRSTLSTIYKSGDLLLHLLTDLLTFSKNSIGQQIQIDETEFRLIDLKTQVVSIFEKQAREGQVDLKVSFMGTNDAYGNSSDETEERVYGPSGTGRVRDMCLWGDKNRILQVLMNFTSNSLKFTPPHGSVEVRIRCTGVAEDSGSLAFNARNPSLQSKQSRASRNSGGRRDRASNRGSKRNSETSLDSDRTPPHASDSSGRDPMLSINVAGTTKQIPQLAVRRRSNSPPPLNTKFLCFEFEVEDTGPGIPEDQQKKIFEPFVQGDLGLSKKYGGTGLGLSICAQLANLMGGSITLKSMVGVGSTFAMAIPLRYVHERAASVASSNARIPSMTSSIVGQPLHDTPRTPRRKISSEDISTNSLDGGREVHEPSLADVPRIVGFTQPYVAKDQIAVQSPKNDLKELKKAETEAAKTGKKVRVLVAEDNKVNQEVVLRMLKLEDVYGG